MIWIKRYLATVLLLAVAGGGEALSAQRGLGGGGLGLRGLGPRLGENVDMALQYRGDLGLSADQVAALEEIREGIRRDVEPWEARLNDMRGAILAGEVAGPQGWAQLQEFWVEYDAVAEPYRIGVASVLSPTQHQTLQDMMFATRTPAGWGWGGAAAGVGWGAGRGPGWGMGRGAAWGAGRGLGWGTGRGAGWAAGRGFVRAGAQAPVRRPFRRGW
jgi:hypothetical protein